MTIAELEAILVRTIEEIQSDIAAYEERIAIQTPDDGLTTDQRAIEALKRPERFSGEHQVAQAWLLNSPSARQWSRNGE